MEKLIKLLKKKAPDFIQEFYIVGGFVRDFYLKVVDYNDIDIIWPVTEFEIEKYFKKSFLVKDRTKTFVSPFFFESKKIKLEITPLRHNSIEADLLSRDLTINSIAIKISKCDDTLIWIDPAGGRDDIKHGILRCWDENNLLEDPLRMLRIFRFQSKYNYEIDSYTFNSIVKHRMMIRLSPKEMIYSELQKTFEGPYCETAFRNMAKTGLLQEIIPEMREIITFRHGDQHHKGETVFEHSLCVLKNCLQKNLETNFRIAALFHDLKKPDVFDGKHYLFHETEGAKATENILESLKFPRKNINEVATIIKFHMIPLESQKKLYEMRYILGKERFLKQIDFIISDKSATDTGWTNSNQFLKFSSLSDKILNSDDFFETMDFLINGDMLLSIGLKESIGIKKILNYLRGYFFKNPDNLSEMKIRTMLENNLKYRESYREMLYGRVFHKRKREYVKDDLIVGILETGEKISFKTGIFEYTYLTEGEFKNWLLKNEKEYSLFF
ncbi:MAG TPA: HD domain-containing protein [Thermotogota bacterium]|nr:HD domain-containing protein [Thermotogota bacterium]